jgi:uncharacterized SAM-binding protein YcdF (DUF218 family)
MKKSIDRKLADDLAVGALIGAVAYALIASTIPPASRAIQLCIAAALLTGGALLRVRIPQILWGMLGCTFAVWLLIAMTQLSPYAVHQLVRRDPMPSALDAIVVLAAGITPDGNLPPRGVDRLLAGLELIRKGLSKNLLITRPSRPEFPHVTAVVDQERLFRLAPSGTELVVVEDVTSTRTEAIGVAAVARERGWRHIALVTSPSHTTRACAVFERVNLKVTCVPSESRDLTVGENTSISGRLRMFQQVVYEWAAISLYRYRDWIDQN